jgi:hypothetical protein
MPGVAVVKMDEAGARRVEAKGKEAPRRPPAQRQETASARRPRRGSIRHAGPWLVEEKAAGNSPTDVPR